MDLTPYVAALRDDLAAAAAVGDEATSRAGSTLAAALEPAVRLALMNALSDLAGEIDAALPEHTVGLRLRGREVDVSVEPDRTQGTAGAEDGAGFFAGPSSSPFAGPGGAGREGGPGRPGFPGGFPGGGFPGGGFPGGGFPGGGGFGEHGGPDVGDISRMTLRIVDQIKGQAEKAAAAQGMSLNSWVSQAVQGALRGQGGWPGRGPEGGERPGRARWTDGRPDDEQPPAGRAGADDAPGGATSSGSRPDGPSGERDEGQGDRRDRVDGPGDDPGEGGVQGWVRG